MKILLVYHSKELNDTRALRVAPLTHPLLAAYAPADIEISIVDESFEEIDFDQDVDLVATTIVVPQAPRAYEVAAEFRKRGRTVLCGGLHPTLMPLEAARHFDSVIIGQGDITWPLVLNDFRHGRLKRFYSSPTEIDMASIPFARRDLLNPKGYSLLNTMQATRGCPHSCTFCTTRAVYPKFAAMPVNRVISEIDRFEGNSWHRKVFGFLDDNLMADPVWAKKLFQEMTPLRKIWLGQTTFSITRDTELVRLASKSGCRCLFLGLESFNSFSLRNCNKTHNAVERYKDGIKLLHDHGISVFAGIMFGFDDDRRDIFEITLENAVNLGIDIIGPNLVVPYPGTAFFESIKSANRLIHMDWAKYNGKHAVFRPRHMTPEELEDGRNWFNWEFHSYRSILKRSWISKAAPWLTLIVNFAQHRILNSHVPEARRKGKVGSHEGLPAD
ncbi:MAG: radical SAM protein [Thermodesulfobacteriota bacterium]